MAQSVDEYVKSRGDLHPTPFILLETVASSAVTGGTTPETKKPKGRVRKDEYIS